MGRYTEVHRCRKHGEYVVGVWESRPVCPECYREKHLGKRKVEVK